MVAYEKGNSWWIREELGGKGNINKIISAL